MAKGRTKKPRGATKPATKPEEPEPVPPLAEKPSPVAPTKRTKRGQEPWRARPRLELLRDRAARRRAGGYLRCRLPRAASPTTIHLSGSGTLCGMLCFPRELEKHLAKVHGVREATDQLIGEAFEACAPVADDDDEEAA